MSKLAAEIAEIPGLIEPCLNGAAEAIEEAAALWREANPAALFTVARGSSDAAATYAANRIARATGVPVGSFMPSLATMYDFDVQKDKRLMALGISQSGASPDLVAGLSAFAPNRRIALTNVNGSELETVATLRLPVGAGIEKSVAATKSFCCTILVIELLASKLTNREILVSNLQLNISQNHLLSIPDLSMLQYHDNCLVLGRGETLAIAQEAALKLKETVGIQAEAISFAEVQHGPRALASRGIPVIMFLPARRPGALLLDSASWFKDYNCPVTIFGNPSIECELSNVLNSIFLFYSTLTDLAAARGYDPDNPTSLGKTTLTY